MVELGDSMFFLGFLVAALATASAQIRPNDQRSERNAGNEWKPNRPNNPTPKGNTVIENKNVNVIVNVDPKDVAKELYKLIQSRLDARPTRRSDDSRRIIGEIEGIVTPMMMSNRRSPKTSAFEVAYALEHVTRRALTTDHPRRSSIDDEIVTREVVARMMSKLKLITKNDNHDSEAFRSTRRMRGPEEIHYEAKNVDDEDDEDEDDDEYDDDRYIIIRVKIRKTELLKGSAHSLGNDSSN